MNSWIASIGNPDRASDMYDLDLSGCDQLVQRRAADREEGRCLRDGQQGWLGRRAAVVFRLSSSVVRVDCRHSLTLRIERRG